MNPVLFFLKGMLGKAMKFASSKDYRSYINETSRLKNLPRYRECTTRLPFDGFRISDTLSFLESYDEIFVNELYDFNTESPAPFIIDCGANIGLSVLWFKKKYPHATLSAFEADPRIFSILEANIIKSGLSDVQLRNEAVWSRDEEIDFLQEGGASGRIQGNSDGGSLVKVKASRLIKFLDRQVDFLKMDIEGAEYEVLKDCRDSLHWVCNLFVEYHSMTGEPQKLNEILSILSEAGFRYYIKEAGVTAKPFIDRRVDSGMDLQLNIFAWRP